MMLRKQWQEKMEAGGGSEGEPLFLYFSASPAAQLGREDTRRTRMQSAPDQCMPLGYYREAHQSKESDASAKPQKRRSSNYSRPSVNRFNAHTNAIVHTQNLEARPPVLS